MLQVDAHFNAIPHLQETTETVEVAATEATPTPTVTMIPTATEESVEVPAPAASDPSLATLNGTVVFQGYPAPPNSLTAAVIQLMLIIPGNTDPRIPV